MQEEQANTALGTYSYMAPEIFAMPSKKHPLQYKDEPASQSYNEKVDTWAIGVLTYELLSGSTPFTGSSVWETVRAIVAGKANPLPSYVSQEAYSFVRDCLMMVRRHPLLALPQYTQFFFRFCNVTPRHLYLVYVHVTSFWGQSPDLQAVTLMYIFDSVFRSRLTKN